eukprot:9451887-Pyramimonas_sp.AAC.1
MPLCDLRRREADSGTTPGLEVGQGEQSGLGTFSSSSPRRRMRICRARARHAQQASIALMRMFQRQGERQTEVA